MYCEFCKSELDSSNCYHSYGNKHWHWFCAISLDYGQNPNREKLITDYYIKQRKRFGQTSRIK